MTSNGMRNAANAYFTGARYVDLTPTEQYTYRPTQEILAKLAKAAYGDVAQIDGMQKVQALSSPEASVYVKPGSHTVVISYRGTVPTRASDIYHDWHISNGTLRGTPRWQRSSKLIDEVHKMIPGSTVILTGHSLGASLARDVSNHPGVSAAVGFNTGYGVTQNALSQKAVNHSKFYDVLNRYDPVSIGGYRRSTGAHKYFNKAGFKAHNVYGT